MTRWGSARVVRGASQKGVTYTWMKQKDSTSGCACAKFSRPWKHERSAHTHTHTHTHTRARTQAHTQAHTQADTDTQRDTRYLRSSMKAVLYAGLHYSREAHVQSRQHY